MYSYKTFVADIICGWICRHCSQFLDEYVSICIISLRWCKKILTTVHLRKLHISAFVIITIFTAFYRHALNLISKIGVKAYFKVVSPVAKHCDEGSWLATLFTSVVSLEVKQICLKVLAWQSGFTSPSCSCPMRTTEWIGMQSPHFRWGIISLWTQHVSR